MRAWEKPHVDVILCECVWLGREKDIEHDGIFIIFFATLLSTSIKSNQINSKMKFDDFFFLKFAFHVNIGSMA